MIVDKDHRDEAVEIRRIDAAFGVEVRGLDPSRPPSEAVFRTLRQALRDHALVLIRGLDFTPRRLDAFVRRFGPLRRFTLLAPRSKAHAERYLCADAPDIMRIGNLKKNGKARAMFTSQATDWHIDDIYKAEPDEATALFAVDTPSSGGDTCFAGLHAAYEALEPARKREVAGLTCLYSVERLDALHRRNDPERPPLRPETVAANPPARHPVVRTDPVTGRRSLFFAQEIDPQVDGMTDDESRRLIAELADHATAPRFQYRHRWVDGDFLIWDNLAVLHRATPFAADGDRRLLYRAMVRRIQ